MKKRAKKIFSVIASGILLASAFVTAGCDFTKTQTSEECIHQFSQYVSLAPTCETKRILESLCSKCGKKEYSPLEANGHSIVNGMCIVCQQKPASSVANLSEDVGWTIEKICNQIANFYPFEEDYVSILKTVTLSDIYITPQGKLCAIAGFTYGEESVLFSLTNLDVRESVTIDKETLNPTETYVKSLSFHGYQGASYYGLTIQTSDNDAKYFGVMADFLPENYPENNVKRILVNTSNEMYFVYEDNAIVYVGQIPLIGETYVSESQNPFVYLYNTYSSSPVLCGSAQTNATSLVIPRSHKGQPIEKIATDAFRYFTDLQMVIIPNSVTHIGSNAFPNGTKIFTDWVTVPSTWNQGILNSCKVYLQGQWTYVNGVPTPLS